MIRNIARHFGLAGSGGAGKGKMVIEKGQKYTLERAFTKNDVKTFSDVSGDKNAVHLDEAAAAKTIFKKPIAHGMLGASLFSNVLGNNIPGAIYMSQTLKFTKPVFYDEKLKAVLTVTSTNPEKKRATLQTQLIKPDGTTAIDGEAMIFVNNDDIEVK
jgi:3-hydroxybutyryl-CoA dehydratase